LYKEITLSSLGGDYPFLWSNIFSICFSGFVAIVGSMADPDSEFKWKYLSPQLPLVDDMPPAVDAGRSAAELDKFLQKSYMNSVIWANFLFFFLCLLFPVSLYLSGLILSSTAFTIWIGVFALWCFVGGLIVIILPIVDFNNDVKAAKAAKEKAVLASKADNANKA